MKFRKYFFILIATGVSACVVTPLKFRATDVVTKNSYVQSKQANGVVLLDVNWGRSWGCGGLENAQLISVAFDKVPVATVANDAEPSLMMHTPSRLFVDPVFINYAFSLVPGEYALSSFSIKVAESVSRVGFLTAHRDALYKNGKPIGGSFLVKPNENVFIGNFYLDCAYGPTLWRYYPDGAADFEKQIEEYKKSFPFLDLSEIKFRLFKTKIFGSHYSLAR